MRPDEWAELKLTSESVNEKKLQVSVIDDTSEHTFAALFLEVEPKEGRLWQRLNVKTKTKHLKTNPTHPEDSLQ